MESWKFTSAPWPNSNCRHLQQYAEVHRQQLLQTNPQELAAAQLPTFELDSLNLQAMFPEVRTYLLFLDFTVCEPNPRRALKHIVSMEQLSPLHGILHLGLCAMD
jgi:hypothetical protein